MQLSINNIRNVLTRLEETIIFGLIERAQFRRNDLVYQRNGMGDVLSGESLLEFLLHESERSHAKVRRYTSPDEHAFFHDLPDPILPPLAYSENPLYPNDININNWIMDTYVKGIIPVICQPGDDGNYGSSAVNDVNLLQALSKRVHYGKFVAESKLHSEPERFTEAMASQSRDRILEAITHPEVEEAVLDRVLRKAAVYTRELGECMPEDGYQLKPETVREIYRKWIIPMNKQVQVLYLLARGADGPVENGYGE